MKQDYVENRQSPRLNMAAILKSSDANGPGTRDVFWFQGCSFRCQGCQNPELWAFQRKRIMSVDSLVAGLRERISRIDGITVSGGEPFEQPIGLAALLEGALALGLSTVVYTGFTFEDLMRCKNGGVARALKATDLLIDGPYISRNRITSKPWIGSSNKRLLCLTSRFSKKDLYAAQMPIEELFVYVDAEGMTFFHTGIKQVDVQMIGPS